MPGTCGEPRRHPAYQLDVLGGEPRSTGLAVQPDNAADEPARLLELISPGGLEEAFRIIDTATDDFDLGPAIAPYGCEGDLEATMPIIEKYRLTFG